MQTITVPSKTIEEIFTRLDNLSKEVRALRSKMFKGEPPYGSDEWWERSIRKGMEDIKKGDYIEFDSVEKLQRHLDSLK